MIRRCFARARIVFILLVTFWLALPAGKAAAHHTVHHRLSHQAVSHNGVKPASQPRVLRVVVFYDPPYVWKESDGLHGLSIVALQRIAAQNNWQIEFNLVQRSDEVLDEIIWNHADIGIGGLTVTADRSLIVDYSDPLRVVPLALITKEQHVGLGKKLVRLITMMLDPAMVILFAFGVVVVLICGVLIRLLERGQNDKVFPPDFRDNAWWAAQTMIAHNCGNKLPLSERGRYIAIFLMMGGTIFTAQITALLTMNLAHSISAESPIGGIGDIGDRSIATVPYTFAHRWLGENHFHTKTYENAEECVRAVEREEVCGAVGDEIAFLRILARQPKRQLKMVGATFGIHSHSMMLRKHSPYLDAVNNGIASLIQSGKMRDIYIQWINGSDSLHL
jgi:polar amino acid transport system substrate-binding protein